MSIEIIITIIVVFLIGFNFHKFLGFIYHGFYIFRLVILVFFVRVGYRLSTGKSYRKELRRRELDRHFPNGPLPREYFEKEDYGKEWIDDYFWAYSPNNGILDKLLRFRTKK